MRIRCIVSSVVGATGATINAEPWLRVGDEYSVLEILLGPTGQIQFRIEGRPPSDIPALHDSRFFEVADPAIPSGWAVELLAEGGCIMGPAAWQVAGFWEDYFSGVPAAVAVFRDVRSGLR